MNNQENAKRLADAIRKFAENPENIDNFEGYLSNHFDAWMKKFAYDPYSLANEFQTFANMI